MIVFLVSGKLSNPGYTAHPTFRVSRTLVLNLGGGGSAKLGYPVAGRTGARVHIIYIVGPLPLRKPMLPPSASMRFITSSNKIGAKSGVCSTQTQ